MRATHLIPSQALKFSHWVAIIMSVALAYQLRLPARLRVEFAERIDRILREQMCPPSLNVQGVVSACMNRLYEGTFVPKGIAPTRYAYKSVARVTLPQTSCPLSLPMQRAQGEHLRVRRLPCRRHPAQHHGPVSFVFTGSLYMCTNGSTRRCLTRCAAPAAARPLPSRPSSRT